MEEISYLVANFNCAPYAAECIRSLASQKDRRWRALICDDCSTDTSLAVIRAAIDASGCADHITLLQNPQNVGYIATLKVLIAAASTDIVAILDADDALDPEATGAILDEYARHPEAGFVYSQYRAIDAQSNAMAPSSPLCAPVPAGTTALLFGFVSHLKTFRRSAYGRTGGLDESIRYAEDRDLVYKLEEVTRLRFVDRVLYSYRLVAGSQSRDDGKFRAGIRNHVLARRHALDRRGVKGLDRWIHELVNRCLLARADGGDTRARAAQYLLRAVRLAVRVSGHSSGRVPEQRG